MLDALVGKSDIAARTRRGRLAPNPTEKMLRTSLSQTTQRLLKEQPLARTPACFQSRLYATEVPWVRPPYRPAPTEQPPAETFSSPSKPRQYYARPVPKRELPVVEVNSSPLQSRIHPSHRLLADGFDDGVGFYRLVAQMACVGYSRDVGSRRLGRVHKVRE